MSGNVTAALYAGNNGHSTESKTGLFGTTTRKAKFRVSSLTGKMERKPTDAQGYGQAIIDVDFDFTNMPQCRKATLVPELFVLSPGANPLETRITTASSTNVPIVPSGALHSWESAGTSLGHNTSMVCLRCDGVCQPTSFDNGAWNNQLVGAPAVPVWGPNTQYTDHGSTYGNSNIIMSMYKSENATPTTIGVGGVTENLIGGQVYKSYSGNEYDCGVEIANNCFQTSTWRFSVTNELGEPYLFGDNGSLGTAAFDPEDISTSWYAEFSIIYEPEMTDFELN